MSWQVTFEVDRDALARQDPGTRRDGLLLRQTGVALTFSRGALFARDGRWILSFKPDAIGGFATWQMPKLLEDLQEHAGVVRISRIEYLGRAVNEADIPRLVEEERRERAEHDEEERRTALRGQLEQQRVEALGAIADAERVLAAARPALEKIEAALAALAAPAVPPTPRYFKFLGTDGDLVGRGIVAVGTV